MTEFEKIARVLAAGDVRFIVIGGWAAIFHGLAHSTYLGQLDLLGEVLGGRSYAELLPHSKEMEANGIKYQCATLERVIQMKRAAGRPKDLEILAALVALLEERRKMEKGELS